jgi:hypothetical protein
MWWLALKAIFGLSIVAIAAFGAGAWIALLLPSRYRLFERIVFVLLGGFGVLSSTLFVIGQLSFTRLSITLTLAVASTIGISLFRRVFSNELSVTSVGSRIPKVPAVVVGGLLAFTAVSGLAEITGDWSNDAIAYHLLGPKVWLRAGVIRPVLDNCHTAFPQIPETLFAALWSIGGDRAPNFSSFLMFGLLLAVAASLAVRCGLSNAEAWWVASIVATMPAVYAGAHGCFVDVIFAAFVLAATRIGFDAQSLREWAIFGMFCGFAIGTKYTGLIAVPALLICVFVLNLKKKDQNLHRVAGRVVLTIAMACFVASPYYIRNWIQLGCPIYPPPPGYALFCSPKYLPPDVISQFHAYIRQRGMGLGRGFFAFLLLPFNLTYHTSNFHGAGGIGLCPLALGAIGIVSFRKNGFARMLIILMFLLTLFWFVSQQESRFLIHVYVLGAVFSVLGWHTVLASGRTVSKYLAGTIVVVSCTYGLFMIGKASIDDVRCVFSPTYAILRRQASTAYFPSFEYLNHQASVRRVLILNRSVTPYHLNMSYTKPIGQWGERTLPGGLDGLQALSLAREHQLDVSHVLDVDSEVSPFQVKSGTLGLTLVFEAKSQRVYRVD